MEEKEIEKIIEEEILDVEVSEVFVVQNSKKRAYIEQFKQKGLNFTQKKLGTFLGFFIVRDSSTSSANIVNFLTSEIKKEYFAFPKRGIAESFETSLHRVNRALAEIANVGNVDWLGTIDGAVCAIDEKTMYFSATGGALFLLLRDGNLIDISEGLTSEEAKKHPLKTFVDISSGQLMAGDKIIITSPELIQLISFEELKRNALKLSRNNFVQFINTVFANECKMATAFIVDVNKKSSFSTQKSENDYEEDNNEIHIPNNVFTAQVFENKNEEKSEISKKDTFPENAEDLNLNQEREFNDENEAEINGEYTDKRTGHIYLQGENVENVNETWSSITDVLKDTSREIKEGTKKTLRKLVKKINKNADFDENNFQESQQKDALEIENEIEQLKQEAKQEVNFKNESQPIKIKVAETENNNEFYEEEKVNNFSSQDLVNCNFDSNSNSNSVDDFKKNEEGRISDFGDDRVYFREDSKFKIDNKNSQDIDYFKPELAQNDLKNQEFLNIKNELKIKVRSEDYQEKNDLDSVEKVEDFKEDFSQSKNEFERGKNNSQYSARSYLNKSDGDFRNDYKNKNESRRNSNFSAENEFEENLENDFRNDLLKRGSFDSLNQKKLNFFQKIINAILLFFVLIFRFILFIFDEIITVFQKMSFRNRIIIIILTLIVIFLSVPLYFFYKKDNSTTPQAVNDQNKPTPAPTPATPQPQPVVTPPVQPQIKANINDPEKIYEDKEFVFVDKMKKEDVLITKNGLVTLSDKSKFSLPTDSGNVKYFAILDDTNSVYFITESSKFFVFNSKEKKFEEKKLGDNKDIKNVKAMSIFGKYLYTLSDTGIIKYTQNESGFANGVKWLKENYNTKSTTDMTINGSIYLVKSGKIEALFSGKKSDFKLENNKKVDLVYAEDTKFLWALNKKEATIYKFDLEKGKLLEEFTHDNIKETIDFSIDEETKTALITTSNKVLKFKLEKK